MAEDKSKVFGIRMEADEIEELKTYMDEEGKGNKEFMQMLLNLYKMNKGKTKNISLIGDIEELEKHTNRIHQSFINIIDKLESQKNSISEEKEKELEIYKEKVNSLRMETSELSSEKSLLTDMLTQVNNANLEIKETNQQLQGSITDKVALIEEYKSKNDMLMGELTKYKEYPTQIENLRLQLSEAQAINNESTNAIKDHEKTIERLNASIIELIKAKDEADVDIKKKHKEELESAKDKAAIEREKAVLDVDKKHQGQIQELQDKHNNEVKEYQAKYKQLLEQLEHVKKTRTEKVDKTAEAKK